MKHDSSKKDSRHPALTSGVATVGYSGRLLPVTTVLTADQTGVLAAIAPATFARLAIIEGLETLLTLHRLFLLPVSAVGATHRARGVALTARQLAAERAAHRPALAGLTVVELLVALLTLHVGHLSYLIPVYRICSRDGPSLAIVQRNEERVT